MAVQFSTTRRVEFAETDMAGIVHFVNFYRYMEQAEHEFFRSLGLKIVDPREDGSVVSWPRVSASCSFHAPAYYEDILEIRLEVTRVGLKSLTVDYEFYRDRVRVARGQMKTACCLCRHGEPMQSIEIPPEVRSLLDPAPPN